MHILGIAGYLQFTVQNGLPKAPKIAHLLAGLRHLNWAVSVLVPQAHGVLMVVPFDGTWRNGTSLT